MADDVELPPLVDLPVYRESYLNQQKTDELCRLLWERKSDYVAQLAEQEKLPFPQNRDAMFSQKMGNVIHFFREEEKRGHIDPISTIAMVDLTYEIDRRVRHVIGLEDIKPMGEQISSEPEGPFPPIEEIHNYISGARNQKPLEMSPERKAIYQQLYQMHPEIIFAYAELHRRWLRRGEPDWFIDQYLKENLPKGSPKLES
jgi:hypothetical protein